MSDLAILALLMGFLISLAITVPIWGYDSRDGIASDQAARRIAWMQPHDAGTSAPRPTRPTPTSQTSRTVQAASSLAAGALRSLAYHLDADAATDERINGRAAAAY